MTLRLHNSAARKKEDFSPRDPKRVSVYVCGPTVYNHAHIGNFRAATVFDQLFRLLRHEYGDDNVVFARNITDIEDKIIKAAQETGKSINEITSHYAKVYRDESRALNILPPTLEPHATDHIDEMISMIGVLMDKGYAYARDGHVLFNTQKYDEYGTLSGVNQDDMLAGARIEVAPYKKNAADFVLWKPSSDEEPGWPTPPEWKLESKGRPGWHLECSAMIEKSLGTTIDIHAGGQDLRFPHHENECAQSHCAHDAPLARVWMHNGFLQMGDDKMSKSLGNVVLVRDLLKEWPGEVIRWALLSAHYRQPLEWTTSLLEQSKKQLDRFYRILLDYSPTDNEVSPSVLDAMRDDMNTPGAMAALHGLRDIASTAKGADLQNALGQLYASGKLLGFFEQDPADWIRHGGMGKDAGNGNDDKEIDRLVEERVAAKKSRDFATADAIRNQLNERGITIEDGPEGSTWRRTK